MIHAQTSIYTSYCYESILDCYSLVDIEYKRVRSPQDDGMNSGAFLLNGCCGPTVRDESLRPCDSISRKFLGGINPAFDISVKKFFAVLSSPRVTLVLTSKLKVSQSGKTPADNMVS
jgi:hypothetical protein